MCRATRYGCKGPVTQILVITYGDDTKEIDLNSVSNSELKPEDFQAFVD